MAVHNGGAHPNMAVALDLGAESCIVKRVIFKESSRLNSHGGGASPRLQPFPTMLDDDFK